MYANINIMFEKDFIGHVKIQLFPRSSNVISLNHSNSIIHNLADVHSIRNVMSDEAIIVFYVLFCHEEYKSV